MGVGLSGAVSALGWQAWCAGFGLRVAALKIGVSLGSESAGLRVREAYIVRIVDLRIQHGLVVIPSAVEYRCDDNSKPFAATFYNDEPRAAVLTWGNDQAIVPAAVSASGARYAAQGVEFWEHQGEASVDFYGNKQACKPAN